MRTKRREKMRGEVGWRAGAGGILNTHTHIFAGKRFRDFHTTAISFLA